MYTPFCGSPVRRRPCRSYASENPFGVVLIKLRMFVSSAIMSLEAKSGTADAKSPLSYNSFAHSNVFFSLAGVIYRIYHKDVKGTRFEITSPYFSAYRANRSASSSVFSFTLRYGVAKTSLLLSVK